MAEKIRAEEGAIEKGAQAVDEAHEEVNRQINDIRTNLDGMRAFWIGDAATAYGQMVNNWQEKANDLNKVLVDLSAKLRQTAEDQASNEASNQSLTSKLQAMLS